MNPFFRSIRARLFPKRELLRIAHKRLLRSPKSFLHQTGWMKSLELKRPCDAEGNIIPWMNYAVIALLKQRLTADMDVFEFGSGYSTRFFAAHVRSVTSVEYDREWFDRVREQAGEGAELIFCEHDTDGGYCRTVHRAGRPYDLVLVDGRDRVNCVREGAGALTSRGVLLLDDSHREKYAPAFDYMVRHGFSEISIEGIKPGGVRMYRTTIFYRPGNVLGI